MALPAQKLSLPNASPLAGTTQGTAFRINIDRLSVGLGEMRPYGMTQRLRPALITEGTNELDDEWMINLANAPNCSLDAHGKRWSTLQRLLQYA